MHTVSFICFIKQDNIKYAPVSLYWDLAQPDSYSLDLNLLELFKAVL
jgi:hypothetical protein